MGAKPVETNDDIEGWRDLALTLADAGLSAPPVPADLRPEIRRTDEWFWSTRSDINPMAMYMFGTYIEEFLASEEVTPYFALSQAGHGFNSYGLSLCLVDGPVGIFVQHGWGGVYMNHIEQATAIAHTYATLHNILAARRDDLPPEFTYLLEYSDFRRVALLYTRDNIDQSSADSESPVDERWRRLGFESEDGLFGEAARNLCAPGSPEIDRLINNVEDPELVREVGEPFLVPRQGNRPSRAGDAIRALRRSRD